MLAYLNAENAYADAVLAPLKPLQDKLYEEIVGRIKQDDSSVPYRERGYWYYTRFETGKDYPIHARRKGSDGRRPRRSCSTSTRWPRARTTSGRRLEVSQDNTLLAWAEDDVGRRQYTLRFKDLATGEVLADAITGVVGQPGLGRRQQDPVLRRERPGDPAHRAGEEARARHAGHARRAGLRGAGRQLLHGRRPHPRRQVHLHRRRAARSSDELRCTPAADPGEFTVLAPRAARRRIRRRPPSAAAG